MKLLLDQGLPRSAVAELHRRGFDALHCQDVGMATASDEALIAWARREGRVVVTLDADFHALMALSNASAPSIIRIRIERLRGQALADLLDRVIAACANDLDSGAMVTVDVRAVRVRLLPLVR